MKRPRVTIRRLLVLVAALAIVFGLLAALERRRARFRDLADLYESARKAAYTGPDEHLLESYHGDLAARYRAASGRPWLPLELDDDPPEIALAFWKGHDAVRKAYPGISLDDYVAQVSVFEGWQGREAPEGRTIYAIRYRRRDNTSGMNVLVDDPVEIHPHSR